ncbi:conjugal transfer protein TraH [Sulfurimonas sp.]|uniref:conjugal transfer protein TraH n=1 Tax=Sulfurimonas sp. TaxID=2022749 RepID=UPI0025E22CDD|nr:conjugal transfer protein TraH [Sulfurimonas sp.]MBW6487555.1 conjugal transfer protein TraH [Sulfurimonas sp.]
MITNKKILAPISLSLSLILITPSVMQAANLDDFVLSTSTSAGSWSDPLGGGTYIYGGDFKFKLKNSVSNAPIFQYKLPSAKRGCSGISIEGGFLSYLGLSNLQEMLSNAGSSLVMGIFLGIEFSLPAVGAVFAKIRAWANALQGLLQNGCNIGKAIAGANGLSEAFHSSTLSDAIEGPFKAMNTYISDGNSGLEWLQELANCNGNEDDPNCKLKDSANKALGKEIEEKKKKNKDVAASASSVSANVMLTHASSSASQDIALITSLSSLYSGTAGNGCSGFTMVQPSSEIKLFESLKYIFFGDIGTNDETIQSFESKIDNESCRIKYDVISADIAQAVTTGNDSIFPTPEYAKIEPVISDPKDAAQMLVFGGSKINEKYSQVTGNTISVPDRKMVYLDIANGRDENGNPLSKMRTVLLSEKKEIFPADNIVWNGAFLESLKNIRDGVQAQTNFTASGINYDEYDTSSVTTSNLPLLVSGIQKYINVIVLLEKRAGQSTPFTEMLKVNLAKTNAILYSRELIGGMESRVLSLVDGTKGEVTAVNDFSKQIRTISSEIRKLLKEMEEEIGRTGFMEEFEKIEREQRIESVKTNR